MTLPPAPIPLKTAFWYWLRLGVISFGGPAGQIAMMHSELVEKRRWISERRFLHALNYCMLLPGPEATQLAIYIGWLLHKTRGGVLAGVLFVLPSLALLTALSAIYLSYGDVPLIAGLLYGIKPAIVAIVIGAAIHIGRRTLKNWLLSGIAVAAFCAIAVFGLPFPFVVAGAALSGVIGARLCPHRFALGGAVPEALAKQLQNNTYGPALIDDDSPTPSHALFSWRRLACTGGTCAILGLGGWLTLAALFGKQGTLTQMAGFFTKAALLTFGGAYAVLPYVYQGAIAHFHWLTPAQMIDGLALGETTPGPLIMIVAFVGFVGSHAAALFGHSPLQLLAAGMLGAAVATFFTFLPSFLFILAGAPLIESTRGNIHLTAPLSAISAAVVGVIMSLALFFAWQVGGGAAAHWDWTAIGMMLAATAAVLRLHLGTIPLIAACAAAGLVLSYLR